MGEYATRYHITTYRELEDVSKILNDHEKCIEAACFVRHDRDEGVEPHIHVVIFLTDSRKENDILNWFVCDGINTFAIQHKYGKASTIKYLTHTDDDSIKKGKTIYDVSEIYFYKCDLFFFSSEKRDVTFQMLEDYLSGVPLRQLAFNYGRDFIFHFKEVVALGEAIRTEESYKKQSEQ